MVVGGQTLEREQGGPRAGRLASRGVELELIATVPRSSRRRTASLLLMPGEKWRTEVSILPARRLVISC